MRVDAESSAPRSLCGHRIDAAIVDLGDCTAGDADKVVMVRRFTGNICMASIGEIDTFHEALGGEEL